MDGQEELKSSLNGNNSTQKQTIVQQPVPALRKYDPFEIVDLMTGIYEIYVKMRYVSRESLKYPPHSPPIDVELAKSLDIDPQVIEIMQRLPYVEGRGSEDEFFQWGSFADYRHPKVLEQSRDPLYMCPEPGTGFDDPNGLYMRPWVLALNGLGNRGSVIFFDTRTGNLLLSFYCCGHITAQWQSGGTADPALQGKPFSSPTPHLVNENSLDNLPSRPAKQFFRDLTLRLHTLEWIPFNNNIHQPSSEGDHQNLEMLFRNYGWPDNFDGVAFDDGAKRFKEFKAVLRQLEAPDNKLRHAKDFLDYWEKDFENISARRNGEIWDNNPTKSSEDVAALEEELKNAQSTLEDGRKDLAKWEERVASRGDHDHEMQRAWEDHLKGHIKWSQGNLDFFKSREDQNDKIKETEEQIARLRAALEKVASLPKTMEEAIKPGGASVFGLDWY